jgi:hypothetical protein
MFYGLRVATMLCALATMTITDIDAMVATEAQRKAGWKEADPGGARCI